MVFDRIGSGGSSTVYRARDLVLGRQVALKVLHPCLADDEESIARFRREAISAAGLRHRNIVGVYDRGEWAGTHYIAMEHVPGRTLRSLIREQAPLAPARAIELVLQVLPATGCMHRGGIIHRDLKPDNAIVDADGQLKLTDFGTARGGESDITKTGTLIGTAHYVSPEQAEGRAAGIPSDLYSVGIILYELLTGRVPFEGETVVSVLLKHATQRPVPPSTFNAAVTSELDAIVLRALAKKPKARFGDAAGFIAALEHARATAAASGPADAMLADGRGAIVSGCEPPGVTRRLGMIHRARLRGSVRLPRIASRRRMPGRRNRLSRHLAHRPPRVSWKRAAVADVDTERADALRAPAV